MKLNSKYFSNLRIRPKEKTFKRRCEYGGCNKNGEFLAKTKTSHEYYYCLDHIKDFNKNYNFFEGMSEEEIIDYQISSIIGHRPTWKSGTNPQANYFSNFARKDGSAFNDPFNFFEEKEKTKQNKNILKNSKKSEEAFQILEYNSKSTKNQIRKKFKEVVKKLHPDTNGGDNSQEDLLKEVISAYKYLKSQGHC